MVVGVQLVPLMGPVGHMLEMVEVMAETADHNTVTVVEAVALAVIPVMAELGDQTKRMVIMDLEVAVAVVHHLNQRLIMAAVVSIHMEKEPLA